MSRLPFDRARASVLAFVALAAATAPAALARPQPPTGVARAFVDSLFAARDTRAAAALVDPRTVHPASLAASVGRFARSGAFTIGAPQAEACAGRGAPGSRACFRVHLVTHMANVAARTVVGTKVTLHLVLTPRHGRWRVSALRVHTASQLVCGINTYNQAQRSHDLRPCRITIAFPR